MKRGICGPFKENDHSVSIKKKTTSRNGKEEKKLIQKLILTNSGVRLGTSAQSVRPQAPRIPELACPRTIFSSTRLPMNSEFQFYTKILETDASIKITTKILLLLLILSMRIRLMTPHHRRQMLPGSKRFVSAKQIWNAANETSINEQSRSSIWGRTIGHSVRCFLLSSRSMLTLRSLSSHLPRHFCRNPRSFTTSDNSALPTLACPLWNPHSQLDCLYLYSHSWILGRWKRRGCSYRVLY